MDLVEASDGVPICFETHGDGDPIVFTTGYCQTRINFRPQIEAFVAAGYRVVLWDFRGHGESGVPAEPGGFRFEQIVDDLGRILDRASPGRPAVACGLSFGGMVSQHFALAHPERLSALVLMSTGPGFRKPQELARWNELVERLASKIERDGLVGHTAGPAGRDCIGARPERPAAREAARAIEAGDPQAVARFGREAVGPAPSTLDRLAEIAVPALVVVGANDPLYRKAAEVMAAKLARAQLAVIAEAGHCVNLEQPTAMNDRVIEFLAGHGLGHRPAG